MNYLEKWNDFWFNEGSVKPLALFRILFAYSLASDVSASLAKSVYAMQGGFHLPYLSFIPLMSPALYQWMHWLQYPFIILIGLGFLMRPAAFILLFMQLWVFFSDQLNFRNHPYFFMLVLLLIGLSKADHALSIRSLFSRQKISQQVPYTWQRLIQIQVCLVYVIAGLHKTSSYFLEGRVLLRFLVKSYRKGNFLPHIPSGWSEYLFGLVTSEPGLFICGWFTLSAEIHIPILIWHKRNRTLAIIEGLILHLGIAETMNIFTFSSAMLASYFLFFGDIPLYDRITLWLSGKNENPAETG